MIRTSSGFRRVRVFTVGRECVMVRVWGEGDSGPMEWSGTYGEDLTLSGTFVGSAADAEEHAVAELRSKLSRFYHRGKILAVELRGVPRGRGIILELDSTRKILLETGIEFPTYREARDYVAEYESLANGH